VIKFIGEDGFYPRWAQGIGRWVHQRVPIRTGNIPLIFPPEANQYLIWVPPKRGFLGMRRTSIKDEITNSIKEVHSIPFQCISCGWQGMGRELDYAGELSYYALRCPKCANTLEPDLNSLNVKIIIEKWINAGEPYLENPGAAPNLIATKPITNLEYWIDSFKPMPNELAYVGQQLWQYFATFIGDMQQ
jgi:hypothetical protein